MSIIFTSLIYFLVCLIVTVPNKYKNPLNNELKTMNDERIKTAM
jgi:hypothetical protein